MSWPPGNLRLVRAKESPRAPNVSGDTPLEARDKEHLDSECKRYLKLGMDGAPSTPPHCCNVIKTKELQIGQCVSR